MLDHKEERLTALLAAPGQYYATLHAMENGKSTLLAGPVDVMVERLGEPALKGSNMEAVLAFWRQYEQLTKEVNTLSIKLSNLEKLSGKLLIAATRASVDQSVMERISSLTQNLNKLNTQLYGNPAKNQIGEKGKPTIGSRLFALNRGVSMSTYGPTATHLMTVDIINDERKSIHEELSLHKAEAQDIGQLINDAGGAWIEGLD